MKALKSVFAGMLILTSSLLVGQESDPPHTLAEKFPIWNISGFGGPIVSFTRVQDEFGLMLGGGGGVLLNQQFFFGGYGMGLATQHQWLDEPGFTQMKDPLIGFAHGGFWLGYIYKPSTLIHWTLSSKIGWGQIFIYDSYKPEESEQLGEDNVFVAIPQVEAEMNLTNWFKMSMGAGFRYVGGIDKEYIIGGNHQNYYQASDFCQPEFSISFLFGGF